ncbi:MAG: translation elongation factor Ts, partial [Candidatus Thiodiazotropha sp.]
GADDVAGLMELPLHEGEDTTVNQAREALISKLGENMNVRRFSIIQASSGKLSSYQHGARIGVVLEVEGGDGELGKDLAMHIAATNPICLSADQMPQDLLEKERDIVTAQAKESGKPDEIVAKMVEGRMRKYLAENTLLGQAFVKDPDTTVEKLLKSKSASILQYTRIEVGEGIEKKQENFAEEVMAQAKM